VKSVGDPADLVDDFIDDGSDFEPLEASFPPVRRATETSSRYFTHESTGQELRQPSGAQDEMEGCDEFEKVTTDECFEKLVRLRNDV
jgi:hypothetical protein